MANPNSTQQTQQQSAIQILRMPTIAIPTDFEQTDYGLPTFDIRTPHGIIHVTAYIDSFNCKGPTAALEAAGLLQINWLPGLPGNNKTSQTIMFENCGHILLVGKRGFRADLPRITITRKSRMTYQVDLPTTEEQMNFIVDMIEKHESEKRDKNQKEKKDTLDCETETPKQYMEIFRFVVSAFEIAIEGRDRLSNHFRYDDDTISKMDQSYALLRDALDHAKILPRFKPGAHREGNVIYLNRSPE